MNHLISKQHWWLGGFTDSTVEAVLEQSLQSLLSHHCTKLHKHSLKVYIQLSALWNHCKHIIGSNHKVTGNQSGAAWQRERLKYHIFHGKRSESYVYIFTRGKVTFSRYKSISKGHFSLSVLQWTYLKVFPA